jgi:hypothetical protein
MDGKLALVYLIIVATITYSYIDDERISLVKRATVAWASARIHAPMHP